MKEAAFSGSFFSLFMPKGKKGYPQSVSLFMPKGKKGCQQGREGRERKKNHKESGVNNRAKIIVTGFGLAVLLCLFLYNGLESRQEASYEYSEEYVQIKEIPAMLSFYYYTEKEWKEKLAEEDFGEVVTSETVKWILEQTGSTEYITYDTEEASDGNSVWPFGNRKKAKRLSRDNWNKTYEKLLDLLDEEKKVLAADEVILKREEDMLVCASGTYHCKLKDLEIQPMTAMQFYRKEDEIVGVRRLKSENTVLSNAYVTEAEEGTLNFLMKGERYQLELAVEEPEKVKNHVCDLLWENGSVAKVQVKGDTIQGNLIAMSDTTVEIEGYGEIRRSSELPVYKTYGTVEEKNLSDIVIANMKVEYVVAREQIEAVLLTEPPQISRIRVLLLSEDGKPCRKEVCIGASSAYKVVCGGEKEKYSKKKTVKADQLFAEKEASSIRIKPTAKKGELFLYDENGKKISNGYKGTLELRKYPEGYAVVNELPIEEYLCAVVPSEMPASYELEALKAQAVCARSYAYIQLGHGDYAAFGAHVDDTTNYQVYNKQKRNEKTTAAVLDTAGKVICYNGETAEAYYFSTSAGVTGDGEAWNLNADPKYGYLKEGLVKEGGGDVDLSSEEAFQTFISAPDASAYENGMPFFRWTAEADYRSEETQDKIRTILNARKERTPEDISFLNKNGKKANTMNQFGNLLTLSVVKRSKSGVILQLKLDYEKGSVLVGSEYNVRSILGAGVTKLTLSDGSEREGGLLPSAYTTLILQEGGTYDMKGGGYGHGIGMSQNGAQAMAKSGKSCEEILKFFFKGIEIEMALESSVEIGVSQ